MGEDCPTSRTFFQKLKPNLMRTIFLLLLLANFQSLQATPSSSLAVYRFSFNDSLPTITCPQNATLNTGFFDCVANYAYTVTASDDEPGWTLAQTAGLPSGSDFPLGATLNEFVATDADGNTATCAFTVTVKDYTPPYMGCPLALTVDVSDSEDSDDCYLPNAPSEFASVVWLGADFFDDGSFDNCSNFLLTIRRIPPYSNFVQTLNPVNGHPPCADPFPDFPSEFERAIAEQDSIKFYCAEVGTTQSVILTAYQLELDGNISLGPNGTPVYNQCLIEVTVEDEVIPVCIPPVQVAVSCEMFDPSNLSAYGEPTLADNCCISHFENSANYSQFDTICNRGTVTRSFLAFDCAGNSSQCTQRVVVSSAQDYYIKFPDDTLVTLCNSTHIYGRPTFFGEDCELMGVSYEDEIFGIQPPDACYKIERIWTVINWCTYDPTLPLTNVPNPTLVPTLYHHPLNAPGPIVSACGTAPPWASTISKITPADTVATDFCTFWSADANGYRYRQIVKILDTALPTIVNCPATHLTFIDSTHNDLNYWNNVFNPALPAQNLGEREVELSLKATDACGGGSVGVQYLLFLDLDADGVMETVVDCDYPPPPGAVFYGNALLPNYIGGTLTEIDSRPVPLNEKWRFTLQKTFLGDTVQADVRWNTAQFPSTYVVPELPVGTHKIKWIMQDGCGNEGICEYGFTVQPSAFECIPPADVAVSCEQFDPSFLTYGEPSWAGSCGIDTFIKSANYAQFDTICSRGTITRVFNALDVCGNTSQCTQRVVVNYTQDYYIKFPNDVLVTSCNSTGVYGEPTFFGEDCELMGVSYEDEVFPIPIPDACYKIDRIWSVINWCTYNPNLLLTNVPNPTPSAILNHPSNLVGPTVSACDAPIPWASTISKLAPTDTVATNFCTFWSANANGYRYTQIVKITDSTNPTIINCPVEPLTFSDSTENHPFYWNNIFNPALPPQNLSETAVDLSIEATDACSGSSLNIQYLLFLDLDADGTMESVVNSVNPPPADTIYYGNLQFPNYIGGTPTSIDNRPVPQSQKWRFAKQNSFIGVNHRIASVRWNTTQSPNTYVVPELPVGTHKIKWFVQDNCGNESVCEQTFTVQPSTFVSSEEPKGTGFALYQNEPNPFGSSTKIRFQLPESTAATLTVFDIKGQIIYSQTTDYGQGEHLVVLEKDRFASPGIFFYKLEAGAFVAWRKMVMLR